MTNDRDVDAAWRAIVENYGDRVQLEEPEVPPQPAPQPDLDAEAEPETIVGAVAGPVEHFVPPEPPPVSVPEPPRLIAWAGVLGVPVLAVVLAVVGFVIPSWAAVLGLAWFVGGFGYLVATMKRGDDDGWDDGAVL